MSRPKTRTASGKMKKLRVNDADRALFDEVCELEGLTFSDEVRSLFRARLRRLRAMGSEQEAARSRRRGASSPPENPAPEEPEAQRRREAAAGNTEE